VSPGIDRKRFAVSKDVGKEMRSWWNEMPHLSKGGKYVFGWSRVREDGRIPIPGEVMKEYHLEPREKVMLISGMTEDSGAGDGYTSLI
jgi:hypothetical protein